MNSTVIYTSLVGNCDDLLQPEVVREDFDYVCFTDQIQTERVGVWEMRTIPFSNKNKSRISRYPKLLPHVVLPEYEYSVYIDANIKIVSEEFYEVINNKIASGCLIAQVRHPTIDCTYDEIAFAFRCNKVTLLQAIRQCAFLKNNKFPRHFGLFENNLIFRRHNHERVVMLSQQWWELYMQYAPRDQFMLMYVYWRNNFMPEYFFDKNTSTRNTPCLRYHLHVRTKRYYGLGTLHWRSYPLIKRLFLHA